jgi:hypothetical protein
MSIPKPYKIKLNNPQKYKGDPNNVWIRSSWELRVLRWMDSNPDVLWFSSEELVIPYYSPIDERMHRYFPDFVMNVRKKDGSTMIYVIEVKPEYQTKLPTQKRKTKRYIQESATYIINQCKWKAADIFCQKKGWKFQILTEKDLGIK